MPLLRSISGLRATVSDGSLSDDVITRHVQAYASLQPDGVIVIGRDGRPSGEHCATVVQDVLCAIGRTVLDLGVVPTPTVQLVVERTAAAGGIIITASHNPADWNGLKFLASDGTFLLPESAMRLWQESDRWQPRVSALRGTVISHSSPLEEHLAALSALPYVEQLRSSAALAGMRITVDAVNASGSRALPLLIEWLGAEPVPLYCDGSGIFPHLPEPLPEHLHQLQQTTLSTGAQLGIAVDPDADRLVLVHASGMPISEEKTIVLATEAMLRQYPHNSVVVNASTTRQVEDVAARYGSRVFRSAVGEINVVALMRSVGAIIGGEGSGGVIAPACHYGRDSLVGTALVLALMSELSPKQWDEMTLTSPYTMCKRTRPWNGEFASLRRALQAAFHNAHQVWEGDGIRFAWEHAWLHVRPSNTEPILRLIAEAPTIADVNELLDHAEALLHSPAA